MRYVPALAATMVFLTAACMPARADTIALYGDSLHTTCSLEQREDFNLLVYVYHQAGAGATGCRFRVPFQDCLADISGPVQLPEFAGTTGNVEDGVTVYYGGVLTGWVHVMTLWYWSTFYPGFPHCCEQPITPHPESATGEVEAFDANGDPEVAATISGIYEGDSSCPCETPTGIPDEEASTWSRVKALYSNR